MALVESLWWTHVPSASAALFSSTPSPPAQQQQETGTGASVELLLAVTVCVALVCAMLALTLYCACAYCGGDRHKKRSKEYGAQAARTSNGARNNPDAGALIKRVDVDYGHVYEYESYPKQEQLLANSLLRCEFITIASLKSSYFYVIYM